MAFATSAMKNAELIDPHGGRLVNLLVGDEERQELTVFASGLPSIQLSPRAMRDLEMLAVGAFSPLDRFMGKRDYKCVLNESRLASGHLFPIPITLAVEPTAELRHGQDVALRDGHHNLLAVMAVQEIYEWDFAHETSRVLRRVDPRHPLLAEMVGLSKVNISGPLRVIQLPRHRELGALGLTPAETRLRLQKMGRANVVAFQTDALLQRHAVEFVVRASQEVNGSALLHPVIGMTNGAGTSEFMQARAYQALTGQFLTPERALLALLPLATRLAGPREVVWQMMIRRNYGANYLILGRDPVASAAEWQSKTFYDPAEAEEIAQLYSGEIGVTLLPGEPSAYLEQDPFQAELRGEPAIRFAPVMPTAWA